MKVAVLVLAACASIPSTLAREFTFEDRVRAQEAIERVYYSHQIGATKPFEEAVPRAVIDKKVATYLGQSSALATHWGRTIDAAMLRDELLRMTRETRLPDRLRELFAALHDDAFLIQECLTRPVLVDRTIRETFASDREIHAAARSEADRTYQELASRRLDPFSEHASRHVYKRAEVKGARLAPVGAIGPVTERPEAFVIQIVLARSHSDAEIAEYAFEKQGFGAWWSEASPTFIGVPVPAVASSLVDLHAVVAPANSSCPPDDTWTFRGRPTERQGHVAVWTGSVMVVWGGSDSAAHPRYPSTGGRYDPATDTWAPMSESNAPEGRTDAAAVWTGSAMIVWGGFDGSYLDTGGRYDPVADTWAPISATNAPTRRSQPLAVWTGTRMVIWSGSDNFSGLATGGRYDPVTDTWTPVSTLSCPSPRSGASAVWTGTEMIVWGGENGSSMQNTGGRYDPSTNHWTATPTLGAAVPRRNHAAVWTGSRMLIWGGYNSTSTSIGNGAAYEPATNTWTPMATAGRPSARSEPMSVWTGSRMLVWGGADSSALLSDGGRYDPLTNAWSPMSTVGAPSGRGGSTSVWTGSLMLIWGGRGTSAECDDGGRYDPASNSWTPLGGPAAPQPRWQHTAVWTGNLMIVWGGSSIPGGVVFSSGERFDLATASWTPISTVGAPPQQGLPFWTGNVMIVWSGAYQTGGRYDPISDSWLPLSMVGAPPGSGAAVWADTRMLAWGGQSGSAYVQTGGRYDPVTDAWSPMTTVGAPSARSSALAVWTGTRLIVWGGYGGTPESRQSVNSGGRYDPATDTWSSTSTTGFVPPPLFDTASPDGGTAVWASGVMVVWAPPGGTRRYDPEADVWSLVTLVNAPPRDPFCSVITTGPLMIVWGGAGSPNTLFSGGRYDPVSDTWTSTSTIDAPLARYGHSAVWTGYSMLIWGGAPGLSSEAEYVGDPDLDGDGFNACGGDCAQRTASVFPGAPQVCDGLNNDCNASGWPSIAGSNEADNDHDGLTACQNDCNDADPGAIARPVEVAGLVVSKPVPASVGVSWDSQSSSAGSGTAYDMIGGSLDEVRAVGIFAGSACLANDQASPTYVDTASHAGSESWYYLVRATNGCGSGGYGDGSLVPDPRDALDASSPCP